MPRTADPTVHETLLDAARAEFGRMGLERAKVEDMVRRAGISKGAFYLHFQTKEDAFREILQRFLGAIEDHARRREEAECRFEEALRQQGGADLEKALDFECGADAELLEIMWRNRQILAAVDSAGGRSTKLVADFRRRIRALVAERISRRQVPGGLRRDVDPEVVADAIVGAYETFGRRMVDMKERPDLPAWARSLLRLVYQGVMGAEAVREGHQQPRNDEKRAG